ncbi:hypothetical protein B0H16DRAFT_1745588 [Mycena metata]|uniref:Uncharacterized protein n=1 Tax=Mycena metata TaxID=1033252 RepID=A0AAD7MC92_9AGAR|nr:hypothetical protein B0H16DRAFT_1746872 [Mycena metata]KAJ7710256.1 hypothetical protein B0H16DRAFT_1745588 [Mycena metata]
MVVYRVCISSFRPTIEAADNTVVEVESKRRCDHRIISLLRLHLFRSLPSTQTELDRDDGNDGQIPSASRRGQPPETVQKWGVLALDSSVSICEIWRWKWDEYGTVEGRGEATCTLAVSQTFFTRCCVCIESIYPLAVPSRPSKDDLAFAHRRVFLVLHSNAASQRPPPPNHQLYSHIAGPLVVALQAVTMLRPARFSCCACEDIKSIVPEHSKLVSDPSVASFTSPPPIQCNSEAAHSVSTVAPHLPVRCLSSESATCPPSLRCNDFLVARASSSRSGVCVRDHRIPEHPCAVTRFSGSTTELPETWILELLTARSPGRRLSYTEIHHHHRVLCFLRMHRAHLSLEGQEEYVNSTRTHTEIITPLTIRIPHSTSFLFSSQDAFLLKLKHKSNLPSCAATILYPGKSRDKGKHAAERHYSGGGAHGGLGRALLLKELVVGAGGRRQPRPARS